MAEALWELSEWTCLFETYCLLKLQVFTTTCYFLCGITKSCGFRATSAQGNHHWPQNIYVCICFPFNVCESPNLKLSHVPPNSKSSGGKKVTLEIVGKWGMPEKERLGCLFWARKEYFLARALWRVQSQALRLFFFSFVTKQLTDFYLKKCGMVSLTKWCWTMHLCPETLTSVGEDEGGECWSFIQGEVWLWLHIAADPSGLN